MNIKQELQRLTSRLDKANHKLEAARQRGDKLVMHQFETEINTLTKSIGSAKKQSNRDLSDKSDRIKALAYNRQLTKQEQADMGKLKKSVRGLVVVHPLTALGRELAIDKVTGFAPKKF
jgi:ribosome-associated protein